MSKPRSRGRPLGGGSNLVPVSVYLPPAVKQWLERIARNRITSAGQVARAILVKAYEEQRERSRASHQPGSLAQPKEGHSS